MKCEWHADELIEHWTIFPRDRKLLGNKSGPTRLGFAVLLKYFQYEGRFPQHPREVPSEIVTYIAQQLDLEPESWSDYDWHGRAIKYHRCRQRELTDTLVGSLIELIHRLGAKAERKVEKERLEDLKRVNGQTGMLFRLAEAALENPDGVVKEIVFPVVNENSLRDLVKEWKSTGPIYRCHVQTVIRSSYQSHYRRMLPKLLQTLEFRSNNAMYQPLMEALALLKKYLQSRARTYPADEEVPIDGVVRDLWLDMASRLDIEPLGFALPAEGGPDSRAAHRQSGRDPQSTSSGTRQLALVNTPR